MAKIDHFKSSFGKDVQGFWRTEYKAERCLWHHTRGEGVVLKPGREKTSGNVIDKYATKDGGEIKYSQSLQSRDESP